MAPSTDSQMVGNSHVQCTLYMYIHCYVSINQNGDMGYVCYSIFVLLCVVRLDMVGYG